MNENDLSDLYYRLENLERQRKEDLDYAKNLEEKLNSKQNLLDNIDRLLRDNRAIVFLLIFLAPLLAGILLAEFSADFKQGEVTGFVRTRQIVIPDQAKTISAILGFGTIIGLSKNDLIALLTSRQNREREEDRDAN